MAASILSPCSTGKEVLIVREFAAPRELVFDAWIDPEQLMRWYAPADCTIQIRALDPRPGGTFHSCIRTPTGKECWCRGVYRTVNRPVQIVFTMVAANERGEAVDPSAVGMDPDWPLETVVTVTFVPKGRRTVLTLHQTVSESLAKRTGAHPSWLQMFDRLAALVARN